ncbi:MAG TPA: 30S ribosomal protein S16 [Deltaproteobacteria bacterium]|nr:30S ribosomal protein S16 [Candidatus Binatota bacterium]HIL13423.1 30S ribosomal protein S16 [Deltaproteobacteria bacterium]
MAVTIRLTRRGTKKRPFYRVVAADKRAPRDGKYLEVLGTYNPLSDPPEVKLEGEKIEQWVKKGAIPSPTVAKLMKKAGLQRTSSTL